MTSIEILYHQPLIGKSCHRVDVPTCWNELSPWQLEQVARLLYSNPDDVYKFRIELLRILLKLKWHHLLMLKGERLIDLFPFVSFIEKDISLTDNKMEAIKFKEGLLYGPIGDFSTLTAEEWTEADQAYLDFSQTGSDDALNRFVAILFRERVENITPSHPDWKNDYRIPFHEAHVKPRIELFERVDKFWKLAVILWWKGCRSEWEEVFERVFREKAEGPESFGWQETILKLSGAEFGDFEKTQTTHMYKLMLKMEVTLKDEEYRKEQERLKSH
jgi:hypothetical protein